MEQEQFHGQDQELIKSDYIEDESLRLTKEELNRLAKNQKLLTMLKSKQLRAQI